MDKITIFSYGNYSYTLDKNIFILNLLKFDVKNNESQPLIFKNTCYNNIVDLLIREAHKISLISIGDKYISIAFNNTLLLENTPIIKTDTLNKINELFKNLS